MAIKIIDIKDTSAILQDALSTLKAGDEILLTQDGKPVARIIPLESHKTNHPRRANLHPNSMKTSDDFDEPLSDSFLAERASRGDRLKFEQALAKVRDVEPDDEDRLSQNSS